MQTGCNPIHGMKLYNQIQTSTAPISIMYKTSMSQLCELDMITVLNNMGFGFMQGATCGLGKFYPMNAERAKELRGQKAPASERLEAEED